MFKQKNRPWIFTAVLVTTARRWKRLNIHQLVNGRDRATERKMTRPSRGMCSDTYDNIHDPWKHYARWKKPVPKGHLYGSRYMTYPELANPETETGQGQGRGEWRVITSWIGVSFAGDENVLKLNSGDGYTTLWTRSMSPMVNFVMCILQFKKTIFKSVRRIRPFNVKTG